MRLADGRAIPVIHSDFVFSSPTGRVVHVFHGPDDASSFIDVLLVTDLELTPAKSDDSPKQGH